MSGLGSCTVSERVEFGTLAWPTLSTPHQAVSCEWDSGLCPGSNMIVYSSKWTTPVFILRAIPFHFGCKETLLAQYQKQRQPKFILQNVDKVQDSSTWWRFLYTDVLLDLGTFLYAKIYGMLSIGKNARKGPATPVSTVQQRPLSLWHISNVGKYLAGEIPFKELIFTYSNAPTQTV